MESPYKVGCSLLFVLFIFIFGSCGLVVDSEQVFVGQKVHTSIKNRLGGGRNLTVHCQSKDDDLGQQNIADGGEFGWDFYVNAMGTTLFYCDMGLAQYHFDAYSFMRDRSRCQTLCSWLVSAEGMYGFNGQTGFWEFMYYWTT